MAKIRRKQSRIAEGLKSGFQRALNFGSSRRNEVAESLISEKREEQEMQEDLLKRDIDASQLRPVPLVNSVISEQKIEDSPKLDSSSTPTETAPEEGKKVEVELNGMRSFAQNIHRLGRDKEIRTMILTQINNFTKFINDNPSDENIEEIRAKLTANQELLENFDKEIEIIEIEEKIKQEAEMMNKLLTQISSLFENLSKELQNGNYDEATKIVGLLNNKIRTDFVTPTGFIVGSYESHDRTLYSLLSKYFRLTEKKYEHDHLDYMTIDYAEKLYREISGVVVNLKNQADSLSESENALIVEYRNLVGSLREVLDSLPYFTKSPEKFKDLQKELDQILTESARKEETSEKDVAHLEAVRIGYEITIQQKILELNKKIRELSVDFIAYDDELDRILEEITLLSDSEKELSDKEKNEIMDRVVEKCNRELLNDFGENLYEFIHDYAEDLQNILEKLSTMSFDDDSFNSEYNNLMSLIAKMQETGNKFGIKVVFDEQSQKLDIDFSTPIMNHFVRQVVSDEVLKAMNSRKAELSGSEEEERKRKEKEEGEQQKIKFREEVVLFAEKYFYLIESQIRKLQFLSFDFLDEVYSNLFHDDRFDLLSLNEKNKIVEEVRKSFDDKLSEKYSEEFLMYIYKELIPAISDTGVLSLRELDPNDENLSSKYEDAIHNLTLFIESLSNNETAQKFIKNIYFDSDTQMLVINYNNAAMKKFEARVVSDEIKEKLSSAKKEEGKETAPIPPASPIQPSSAGQPSVPGASPEPRTSGIPENSGELGTIDDEKTFIDSYLTKVEEVNNIVLLINEINVTLESQAIINFLNPLDAKIAINMEERAKSLDQRLIDLKIELSKDRLLFKKKFNKFILGIPEVKAIQMLDIKFSGNLNDFIKQHDEMIVEAENKIFELAKLRNENPTNLNEINEEIQNLMSFIDSQNSLVGRRLVSEAKTSEIDIVSLLQERRENKKEIRERLRQVQKNIQVTEEEAKLSKPNEQATEPAGDLGPAPTSAPEKDKRVYENQETEIRVQRFFRLQELLEAELRRQVVNERTEFNDRTFIQNFTLETKEYIEELRGYYASKFIDTIIDRYASDYNNILMKEKSYLISELFDSIKRIQFAITSEDVIEQNFEKDLIDTLNDVIDYYKDIKDLTLEYNNVSNMLIVKYTVERVDFDNSIVVTEPVRKYVDKFLAPNVYEVYMNKKKEDVEVNADLLRFVGEYFIDGYSNGKFVFQSLAKNTLLKESNFSIEEIEVAIEQLIQMGFIENRRGLLGAICTKEEFLSKFENTEEQDLSSQDKDLEEENSKQEEPKVNIVQRGLVFNPKDNEQLATRAKNIITTGDAVTVSLIKNGIKIKYSQELREKLSQLNAKLSLVNKENYRVRTSTMVDSEVEEQTVAFKDEREIRPEDYKIEIRVPNASETDALYEFDLANVSEDLKGRTK